MKKLGILLSLFACQAALAGESAKAEVIKGFDPLYLGINFAASDFSNGIEDTFRKDGIHKFFDGVQAGYYFNPNWAVQAEYQHFGEIKHKTPGEADMFALSAVYQGALSESVSYFGKLGAGYVEGINDQGAVPLAGVGLNYRLLDNLELRAEYQFAHDVPVFDGSDTDNHRFSFGVSWYFGGTDKPAPVVAPVVVVPPVVEKPVEQKPVEEAVVLPSPQVVYFDTASTEVNNMEVLHDLVKALAGKSDLEYVVTGYTDEVGSSKFNKQLAEQRALRVANFLKAYGIAGAKIQVISGGELERDGVEDNAAQRRVEIEFTK